MDDWMVGETAACLKDWEVFNELEVIIFGQIVPSILYAHLEFAISQEI